MANPWTKKNPLMSLWLSSANTVAGHARAQGTRAWQQQAASARQDATRQVLEFWGLAPPRRAAAKRRRKP